MVDWKGLVSAVWWMVLLEGIGYPGRLEGDLARSTLWRRLADDGKRFQAMYVVLPIASRREVLRGRRSGGGGMRKSGRMYFGKRLADFS